MELGKLLLYQLSYARLAPQLSYSPTDTGGDEPHDERRHRTTTFLAAVTPPYPYRRHVRTASITYWPPSGSQARRASSHRQTAPRQGKKRM
jgi:hypothetical protein